MSKLMLTILAFPILAATDAGAVCPNIQRAFTYKMKEYRAYRDENRKAYSVLLGREVACKKKGAVVSASLAGAAQALSCRALADASRLNGEVQGIGAECEAGFNKLHELQVNLKKAFMVVQDKLETSVEYMKGSRVLQEACPNELDLGVKMVKAFLKLEGDILLVEARSFSGKTDYGKFADAAAQLKAVNATTSGKCGGLEGGPREKPGRNVASTYAAGAGAGPAGKSIRSASDITGTPRAIEEAGISARQAAENK